MSGIWYPNLCSLSTPVYGHRQQAKKKQSQDTKNVVETGVWNGTGFVTTKSTLKGPVQSTVGIGVATLTADRDTFERGGETIKDKHNASNDSNHTR